MSDVKEIARQHLSDPALNGNAELITDLLAELERVEEMLAESCIEARAEGPHESTVGPCLEIMKANRRIAELEAENERSVEIAEANIWVEIANGGTSCHWCEGKTRRQTAQECVEILTKASKMRKKWYSDDCVRMTYAIGLVKSVFRLEEKS